MTIIHWLFKSPNNASRSRNNREQCNIEEEEAKSRELVIFDKGAEESDAAKSNTFTILLRREDSRACFYSTLRLRHRNSLNFARMGQKSAEPVAVGRKVLPICDIATLGSRSSVNISSSEGPDKDVQKRRKAVSRMKEVIRWAAAAKNNKAAGIKGWKVLYFRNKMALKNSLDDDESTSSSKISFRWDVGSCSTSSSVVSSLSLPTVSRIDHQMCVKNASSSAIAVHSSNSPKTEGCSRGGQWITSDSDFVVLEL